MGSDLIAAITDCIEPVARLSKHKSPVPILAVTNSEALARHCKTSLVCIHVVPTHFASDAEVLDDMVGYATVLNLDAKRCSVVSDEFGQKIATVHASTSFNVVMDNAEKPRAPTQSDLVRGATAKISIADIAVFVNNCAKKRRSFARSGRNAGQKRAWGAFSTQA